MEPKILGEKYDKIAHLRHEQHDNSAYGVAQFKKALGFASAGGRALDVGCGAGGRFVRLLQAQNFLVTGVDVSAEMIKIASKKHPDQTFVHQDICTWQLPYQYDFIVAWDSIFHLPFSSQKPVVSKLCAGLAQDGILVYTFGNAHGEITDQWHNDTFYYSSIGINENLQLLMDNGLSILHLDLDQYPQTHVYVIAARL